MAEKGEKMKKNGTKMNLNYELNQRKEKKYKNSKIIILTKLG